MATSVKQLVEAANAVVPRITAAQAQELIAKGNALVVDVRDAPEVQQREGHRRRARPAECSDSGRTRNRRTTTTISARIRR